uniref:Glycoside hydrolase family 31 TIM barrel domain-containing protein n=1 Tax=Parascaris equorum TaxID=6256 RepID=A0A914RMG5_PAREQ
MDKYQDFTLGKEWQQLSTYFNQLHDQDIHAVLTLDASISHASFFEWERIDQAPKSIQSLYNSTNNTKIMLGVSWPDAHVAFPDFGAEETINWWVDEIATFHEMTDPWYFKSPKHSKIAPLMCPLNGTDAYYDVPPYETFSVSNETFMHSSSKEYNTSEILSYLSSKTLCMLAVSKSGRIYDTKNLYGLQQSIATHKALQVAISKRGLLLSESLFPSGGHYAGHALGDNFATWSNLARSVVGIQLFNIFGIPYVGADICGFHGETITDDLCSRWHQLGAFYSLARVRSENRLIPQNLSAWLVQARQANLFRYMYLPYLYTEQFMWGSALLIAPVLRPNMTVTYAYLPRSVSWYSLRNEDFGVKAPKGFSLFTASAFMLPPVFIKGGFFQCSSFNMRNYFVFQGVQSSLTNYRQTRPFQLGKIHSSSLLLLFALTISDFERYNYIELHIDFKLDVEAVLTLTLIKKCFLTDDYRNEALSPDYDFARRWHPKNLYGVFPFYIGFERDGNAHGVFILNSNAQVKEITLGMAPHIVYRTIGGMLDIFFFPGPTPDDVIRQFTALVGKPALPPYWSFGFQLGRFGYDNLKQMRNTIASVQQKNIPLDVVHADIDYMIRYQDFTLNSVSLNGKASQIISLLFMMLVSTLCLRLILPCKLTVFHSAEH